nr:hypothetical protein [Deltaproteobacteria bacterium]
MEVTGPFVQLRRAPLRAVATTFLRRRPWVVALSAGGAGGAARDERRPAVQVAVVLVGFALVLTFFTWESWRGRRALEPSGASSGRCSPPWRASRWGCSAPEASRARCSRCSSRRR